MMETVMKASINMATSMAKDRKKLLILTLFDDSVGKYFWNDGESYEGEF